MRMLFWADRNKSWNSVHATSFAGTMVTCINDQPLCYIKDLYCWKLFKIAFVFLRPAPTHLGPDGEFKGL